MKNYNFKKAKQLIEENKENLVSAALGMHEEWFWTAEPIFENGEYLRELPDDAEELEMQYNKACEEGLSMFLEEIDKVGLPQLNPEYPKYTAHHIAGIFGSYWATPTLQLCFKDGTDKMIPCHNDGTSTKCENLDFLGELLGPFQEQITPLS